jgi:hypothetical protein
MPLCGQEQSRLDPADRVFYQSFEVVPVFVGDGGLEVLHLNRTLADEDDLGNFVDAGYPGVADQLRVKPRYTGRLLGIAGRRGLPLQHASCAVQLADRIDEGHKAVA